MAPRYEKWFSIWRPLSGIWKNCRSDHVSNICMWFFISVPNFALIGQYCAGIAKNDCNMAFVRHLEFAKFRRFDRYSSWELKCVFVYQILSKSDNSRLRYWDKAVFKMVAICHLEFGKFQFSVKVHPRNGNLHLHTKFDRNRIIHSWDMAIMLFSKWRPSAILNLPNLQFWSRGLYRRVILHLCSKFQWRRNR